MNKKKKALFNLVGIVLIFALFYGEYKLIFSAQSKMMETMNPRIIIYASIGLIFMNLIAGLLLGWENLAQVFREKEKKLRFDIPQLIIFLPSVAMLAGAYLILVTDKLPMALGAFLAQTQSVGWYFFGVIAGYSLSKLFIRVEAPKKEEIIADDMVNGEIVQGENDLTTEVLEDIKEEPSEEEIEEAEESFEAETIKEKDQSEGEDEDKTCE